MLLVLECGSAAVWSSRFVVRSLELKGVETQGKKKKKTTTLGKKEVPRRQENKR